MGEVDLLVLKVEWLTVQQVESFVELFYLSATNRSKRQEHSRLHKHKSASGLVVKFNVAIVEPLVRFRACASIRDSLVARISACHAGDPGSIPGLGVFTTFLFLLICVLKWCKFNFAHKQKSPLISKRQPTWISGRHIVLPN
jgi:hypothetical protein